MISLDGEFGEALKSFGIPAEHSIFAAAYGKSIWGESGYRLMTLKAAVRYAREGRDVLWFYNELKRRYENIFYFFKRQ